MFEDLPAGWDLERSSSIRTSLPHQSDQSDQSEAGEDDAGPVLGSRRRGAHDDGLGCCSSSLTQRQVRAGV